MRAHARDGVDTTTTLIRIIVMMIITMSIIKMTMNMMVINIIIMTTMTNMMMMMMTIRKEVASSRLDCLPTLSAAKTSKLSLLVKSHFWRRSGRCRQCCSDFLLQCSGDIEADHTDSGIHMDCADRKRETPHLGD